MFSEITKTCVFDLIKKPRKLADCGIELEIEGKYLPESVPGWKGKPEGSLQGGVEYITNPMKADNVAAAVDSLRNSILSSGGVYHETEIIPSYRCSTHIHVNMLPETVGDMLGFCVIFTMFEPVLLSLCGPQRDGNLFCLSSYDTGDVVPAFHSLCHQIHYSKEYGFAFERGKYAALNAGRLPDLGTLEVRCFPLSVEGSVVSKWVQWLLAMKDLARAQPDKTYREFWKLVRQNPQWYATKIFGNECLALPNLSSLVDLGTETAYELTKVLKAWYSNKEPLKKKRGGKKKLSDDLVNQWQTLSGITPQPPSWGATVTISNPIPVPEDE